MTDKPLPYALQLAAAGITPDKPLYAVMVAVHEAADAARDAAQGARGLTPEGEAALVQRIGREVGVRLAPLPRAHLLRTSLLGAAVLFGVAALTGATAYTLGRAQGGDARVAALCQGTAVQPQAKGGTACSFWLTPPAGERR